MARVFIDVSVFSQGWFQAVLNDDLLHNAAVRFVYTDHKKLVQEHQNARKIGALYKLWGDQNRRDDVNSAACDIHINNLSSSAEWKKESACDDPHIFAMIYEKPTKYVFTSDIRIAACRDCINKVVENRYCDFIVISKKDTYSNHRQSILK